MEKTAQAPAPQQPQAQQPPQGTMNLVASMAQQQQHQQQQLQQQPIHHHNQSLVQHALFDFSPIQAWDETDDRIHKSFHSLKQLVTDKSPKECHELYTKFLLAQPPKSVEDFNYGLLAAILVLDQDPHGQMSHKYFRDVVTLNKDGLATFSNCLCFIIAERLQKLKDHSIKQAFWAANQLMKAGINGAENVCVSFMRSISGGDLSPRNLWLAESLIDLLIENRQWLISTNSFVVPLVIYSYMRLLADHMLPAQTALRQKETDFVIGLIREKFLDCIQIGRDFLRVLYNINKIPEFEKLWHDIFNDPKSLHTTFASPMQILANRSPRRLFSCRLTVEMERKISFLAQNVRFGNQKRYQDWFHRQFLATPESQTLRSDLIRYICTVIHPTNEVLCSDIIPRWAVIGWLLTTCTTSASAHSSRLALFYDWIIYDVKQDNIMNIEPGILVMYYSMRSHPNVTLGLLDFLCRLPSVFVPKLSDQIRAGIKTSLHQILEKKVVPTLCPLFDNPKHDITLKSLIRDNFPEFCASQTPTIQPTDNGISTNQHSAGPTAQQQAHQMPQANHTTNTQQQSLPHTPSLAQQTPQLMPQHQIMSTTSHPTLANQVIKLEVPTVASDDRLGDPNQVIVTQPPAPALNRPSDISVLATSRNCEDLILHTQPTHINNEDKLSSSNASSAPSPLLSPTATPDAAKAFSWNGNENANASYSHKQNHDNKNRKPSVSLSSTTTNPSVANNFSTYNSIDAARKSARDLKLEATGDNPDQTVALANRRSSFSTPIYDAYERELCQESLDGDQVRVIYPFMTVDNFNMNELLTNINDEKIVECIEGLDHNLDTNTRVTSMKNLITHLATVDDYQSHIDELGHMIAYSVANDFSTKIFPPEASYVSSASESDIEKALEESISSPLFILCRHALGRSKKDVCDSQLMMLLAAVARYFEATYFLVLYYCRAIVPDMKAIKLQYVDFCQVANRDLNKCLHDDMAMCLTYDPLMLCFLLPGIFSELAQHGAFKITGNIDLIHLAMTALDPTSLQEVLCLCLPNTIKFISKDDDVASLIGE